MVDFAKLAAQAKAASDQKISQAEAEHNAKQDARKRIVDIGIAALTEHVMPVLERASAELKTRQIDLEIAEKFDVYNHYHTVSPSLIIQALGPKRPSDGYRFSTLKASFNSFGDNLSVYVAKDSIASIPDRPTATVDFIQTEDAVGQAVEKILADYFVTLREKPFAWSD